MRIAELHTAGRPVFSFEFFPPKTDAGYRSLYRTIRELKSCEPGFVSVTCGAAGATRRKTADLVIKIQQDLGITAMAHMVCTGTTRDALRETLEQLSAAGIQNVLTLRGDPPRNEPEWRPIENGFGHANELAAFVKREFDFCLGGACYPEKHPEAPSPEADLEALKLKIEAGVEFLVTQLFFDNADYFAFVERARAAGITVPIVPGIMPVVSLANLRRCLALSPGSNVPAPLETGLEAAGEAAERSLDVGVAWATEQCRELLEGGAPGIHFYTLNRSPATQRVHEALRRQ